MDPWIVVVVALIALALGALLALALKRGGGQLAASLEQLAHSQAAAQQSRWPQAQGSDMTPMTAARTSSAVRRATSSSRSRPRY